MPTRLMVALLALFLLSGGQARADETPVSEVSDERVSLAADRPGFGDATSVAPRYRLIMEAGLVQVTSDEGLSLALPLGLLRVGLTSWLEARVQLPGLEVPIGEDHAPAGTNGALGFKVAFDLHESVALSVVSNFGLPVVELLDGYSAFQWSSTVNLGISVSEVLGFGLTGASGVLLPIGVEDAALSWEVGGALTLVGTFDDTGLYFEGIVVGDQTGDLRIALGLGASHMLTPELQLDLYFDYDLPEFGATTRVGVGVATLF